MKKVLVCISMIGLGFVLAWLTSEDSTPLKVELESLKTEVQQLKTATGKTESERDTLKVIIALGEKNRDELQEQVAKLIESRDKIQMQLEEFTFSRDQSQQQLVEIIGKRDKLKEQLAELTSSHDKLQQQLTGLTTSRNQLRRQVSELTVSRDAAVADAQVAQKRIDKLVILLDDETQKFGGLQKELIVTNQAIEQPAALTELVEPVVISSEVSEPPVVSSEVAEPVVTNGDTGERPTCHSFNTNRPVIMPGQTSTLSWQVSKADQIRIDPEVGSVTALGSKSVKPSATTTYTLIATNKAGESRQSLRIEVDEAPAVQNQASEQPATVMEVVETPVISNKAGERPTCHSFNTSRPAIIPGQTSTLSWQVSNAKSIRIEPEVGPVSALGARTVKPSATTTYTLIATNQAGDSELSRSVEVSEQINIFSSDSISSQVLLEEYKASDDSEVLSEQKPSASNPNATQGKFLGYRARKDESGKFLFIPVYENKQEE